MHEVGTGKTCAAFAIAEVNKQLMKKTIFLSPSQDLNKQQKLVLINKCFPKKYNNIKDLSYYNFTTPQTLAHRVQNMSNKQIRNEFDNTIFIIDEVHKIKYENTHQKKQELGRLIKKRNLITDEKKKEKLKRKILKLEDQTIQTYLQLQKIFTIASNIKVVLLTATPMVDKASEIIGILNLILPNKDKLNSNIIKFSKPNDKNIFLKAIKGRVSYLKASEITTTKIFNTGYYLNYTTNDSSLFPSKLKTQISKNVNMNIMLCVMSDIQTDIYLKSWCEAIYKASNKQWIGKVPELCNSVVPPSKQKTLAYSAEQASLLIVENKNKKYIFGSKIKYSQSGKSTVLENFLKLIKEKARDKKTSFAEELYPYSPKYSLTLKRLNEAYEQDKKVFIYIRAVSGGGAKALRKILIANNYRDATFSRTFLKKEGLKRLPKKKEKRFIFLTGDTNINKTSVIDIFNNPRNAKGEYIQLIVGTDTITQGYSIKDIQEMHVHDPPWNYSTLEQAIGRVVRRDSHDTINKILQAAGKNDAKVNIFLYAAIPNFISTIGKKFLSDQKKLEDKNLIYWNSIDLKKYILMSEKDKEIKKIEKLLKENAFDCPLFYNRNIRKFADNGSRECEYSSCEYSCTGVDMKEVLGEKSVKLIDVNYNILYNHKDN